METVRQIQELQKIINKQKDKGVAISFVPTMGALHEGHLSLIRLAQKQADFVICSIFVNPTQFDNVSDLKKYPRQVDDDAALLSPLDVDVLFVPSVEEMYPEDHVANKIDFKGLDKVMEGSNRVGHFDGVVEVVSRFFEIIEPDYSVFGKKDFQQLAVIKRMCAHLEFDTKIIGAKIIREKNGLAMSSRNQRLSEEGKENAAIIYKTLKRARKKAKDKSPTEIKEWVKKKFGKLDFIKLEYFEIADADYLQPIEEWNKDVKARAFIVAWVEGVRLIDNVGL